MQKQNFYNQMDGNYLNKFLENWYFDIIRTEGWQRTEDLHITDIVEKFKIKDSILDLSLFILNCLKKINNEEPYVLLLAISLKPILEKINTTEIDLFFLNSKIDGSSPSIYLFNKENYNLEMTLKRSEEIGCINNFKMFIYYEIEDDLIYYNLYFL